MSLHRTRSATDFRGSGQRWARAVARRVSYALGAVAFGAAAVSAQVAPPAGASVSGVVYDSIARRPIPRVTVQLVNADDPGGNGVFTGISNDAGRYSIEGVPAGRYLAGFFHSALDTLGLEVPARIVQIGSGAQRVDLGTPSPLTLMRSFCSTADADSTGVFMGMVRNTDDEARIAGASVVVEWSEFVLDGARLYERPRQGTVRTSDPGWFAICGLPSDVVLLARAYRGADTSGYVEVQVPAGGVRHQTFLIGGASEVPFPMDGSPTVAGQASVAATVLRGDARLTGTVLDSAGKPVTNAHVVAWGTNRDAQTNDRGAFVLDGLPGGTHTIEIRVIGYVPVTRVVHLAASRPATIEIRMDKTPVVLATETVRGTVVYSRRLVEFDRRRRMGFGKYVTTAELDRRPNARLSHILQGMLGVYVQQSTGRNSISMRSPTRGYCTPTLYVDGNRDLSGDFDYLFSDQIAGIEVYTRESERPAGYLDFNSCGAVLVWTRLRPDPPKKDDMR